MEICSLLLDYILIKSRHSTFLVLIASLRSCDFQPGIAAQLPKNICSLLQSLGISLLRPVDRYRTLGIHANVWWCLSLRHSQWVNVMGLFHDTGSFGRWWLWTTCVWPVSHRRFNWEKSLLTRISNFMQHCRLVLIPKFLMRAFNVYYRSLYCICKLLLNFKIFCTAF